MIRTIKMGWLALFAVAAVSCTQKTLTEKEMRADWAQMNASKVETLQQFNNDKFGMFIHWGLYSVPAGEWKGQRMEEMDGPLIAEWIQYSAKIPRAEYAKLATKFNPTDFNAEAIAKLAKAAGMKYLVITSKHHDGFAMYDSKCSKYDIMDATPFKRDVVAELYKACKKEDIDFGLYYSQDLDWMDGHDC
ncbi:MAG: alpha-L-fucosidase, partial [Massilibacteroides sp.]|nr:alpha-L-fucosidase [Massilibacteroides sp.]